MAHSDDVDGFDERLAAMQRVFGKSADIVLHAVVPFEFGSDLGGRADVVQFHDHINGVIYVTCDLLGNTKQVANSLGTYELAICHRYNEERYKEDWGPEIIAALAYYTLDAQVEAGHTMDIGSSASKESLISAFLFDEFAAFDFRGQPAGVLLCIGITADELSACRHGQGHRVLGALKSKGVYPFTDMGRRSVLG